MVNVNLYLCIQLISANIILNLSIFILKFSDHLFSNLTIDMCQEKKRIGCVLCGKKRMLNEKMKKKIFFGCQLHIWRWTSKILIHQSFSHNQILWLHSSWSSLFLSHSSFSFLSLAFFCFTKLRLYYVIDVLTYLPSQNRFYHDPFTPSSI